MKTVFPNIWLLIFRIALLAFFIYMYQWPIEKIQSGSYKENVIMFIISGLAISMFPAYLIWTLLKILWLRISIDESKVHFHYLFKSIEVCSSDIDGYYRTIHKTKVKSYNGILIKLKNGKVLEVSEYNLRSIDNIMALLKSYKVPYRGSKDSWFPLTRRV